MKDKIKKLKQINKKYLLLVFFFLCIFRKNIIYFIGNINELTSKKGTINQVELTLLKEENEQLKRELEQVSNLLPYAKYHYSLTRLNYKENYSTTKIHIQGGQDKDYKEGQAIINEFGLVGIIEKVGKEESSATLLTGLSNFSVRINNAYGTITGYQDGVFIIENISNYDEVHLNDEVYTSSLGNIKENLFIGSVSEIEGQTIEKKIKMKSKVDFKEIHYLYVVGDV